jgi:ABC-type transport system involved in Fe-S cluster assembly fused permease/ATPase subunit
MIFFIFQQSGYNTRVKAVHIVNARPWTESLITMFKFVLKNKIAARVSVPAYFLSFSTQNLVTQHIYVSIHKNKLVVFLAD